MFKHVEPRGSKEKKQTILTNGISAPIKNSNLESVKLPNLGQYRKSKIVQIPGGLESNNISEKLQLEKFVLTNANPKILGKYDPKQLYRAGDLNSQPIEQDGDELKQNEFARGQEILQNMGYTQIFRIENKLLAQEKTKKITLFSNFKH